MSDDTDQANKPQPRYTKEHPLSTDTGIIWKDDDEEEWRFHCDSLPELFMEEAGIWTNRFRDEEGDPSISLIIWRYGEPDDYDFTKDAPPPPSATMIRRMNLLLSELHQRKDSKESNTTSSDFTKQLAHLFYQDWHGQFTESISHMWWTNNVNEVQEDFARRQKPMPQNVAELQDLLELDHFIVLAQEDTTRPPYNAWIDFSCGEMELEHSLGAMIYISDDDDDQKKDDCHPRSTKEPTTDDDNVNSFTKPQATSQQQPKKVQEDDNCTSLPSKKKARIINHDNKNADALHPAEPIICIKGFSYSFAAS